MDLYVIGFVLFAIAAITFAVFLITEWVVNRFLERRWRRSRIIQIEHQPNGRKT